MNKYKLNHHLIKNLSTVLSLNVKDFEKKVGFRYSLVYYWISISDIPLVKLIKICNTFHIPISHFIVHEGQELTVLTKEDYIVPKNWKDITYDFTLANSDLTIKERKTVREICSIMQCSSKTYCKIFPKNNIGNVMTNDILRLMNSTDLFIGDYIHDDNRPIPLPEGVVHRDHLDYDYILSVQQTSKYYEQMIKSYQSRLSSYKIKLTNKDKQIEQLEKENARLRRELALVGIGSMMVAEAK